MCIQAYQPIIDLACSLPVLRRPSSNLAEPDVRHDHPPPSKPPRICAVLVRRRARETTLVRRGYGTRPLKQLSRQQQAEQSWLLA